MKTITILSGKGGVGKSSITASLAVELSKDKKIICADCDVDASNLSLVLGATTYEEWEDLSTNVKAVFDLKKCNSCKKCFNECYFNAIKWVNNKPVLKDFSCEGCGMCELVCPENAITMEEVFNAKIGYANTKYGFKVVSAQLNAGESGSGKVVSEVKKKTKDLGFDSEIMLVDSAAGIGCPVIASITGSDYVIVVTEPSPSGFSDMKRALEVVNHFKIQAGVIINKFDLNQEQTKKIEEFAKTNKLDLIEKIPFDKQFAKALVEMTPIIKFDHKYVKIFKNIKNQLLNNIK